ncbi:MAG: hypothetical protein ACRCVJ_00770 [Clostridium sp.]|uniref:hypothetical protein n=1 Tax=Clostridium sp. TaxID=1506 RepID=UPI003F2F5F46
MSTFKTLNKDIENVEDLISDLGIEASSLEVDEDGSICYLDELQEKIKETSLAFENLKLTVDDIKNVIEEMI